MHSKLDDPVTFVHTTEIRADANQKMKHKQINRVAIQSPYLRGLPKFVGRMQCSRTAGCACAKFINFRWFRRCEAKPTQPVACARRAYLRRKLHSFGKFNQQLNGNVCHLRAPWQYGASRSSDFGLWYIDTIIVCVTLRNVRSSSSIASIITICVHVPG